MMKNRKTIALDVALLFALIVISLLLIAFYFPAQYLETGYPDWMVHAFRAKFIQTHGFSSWTHFWSNGIGVLRAYQFVPHYLTIWLSSALDVSIVRSMVIMTIVQFILLKITIYLVMRGIGMSPIASFISALLTLNIAQYWGTVSDYSLMFAVTCFPVIIYMWKRYLEEKYTFLFPYLCGIAFYIHPLLGIYSFALGIVAVICSERKILSQSHLIQLLIFLAASSLFWYPLVAKNTYYYSSEQFANLSFLSLVLSHYNYYGLSLYLFIAIVFIIIRSLMPTTPNLRWFTILTVYTVFFLAFIIIGTKFPLPKAISQLQFTRGISLIGIALVIAFGVVIDTIKNMKSTLIKGVGVFLFCVAMIEGVWFVSVYSPYPGNELSEPVSSFIKKGGGKMLQNGRIWVPDIGKGSYLIPLSYRLPVSYMGHLEFNQIPPRLNPLMQEHPYLTSIPRSNIDRITTYFKLTGTKHVFLEETSPFTRSLLDPSKSNYIDKGIFEFPGSIYHLFQTPGNVYDALLIDNKYSHKTDHFPYDLYFSKVNDQTALDDYVQRFSVMLDQKENTPLTVSYPAQDQIEIKIPAKRSSNLIFLKESYDVGWHAYFQGKAQKIMSSGPNFMKITLEGNDEEGVLILKHSWPASWYISIYLILLIPLQIGLYNKLYYYRTKAYAAH